MHNIVATAVRLTAPWDCTQHDSFILLQGQDVRRSAAGSAPSARDRENPSAQPVRQRGADEDFFLAPQGGTMGRGSQGWNTKGGANPQGPSAPPGRPGGPAGPADVGSGSRAGAGVGGRADVDRDRPRGQEEVRNAHGLLPQRRGLPGTRIHIGPIELRAAASTETAQPAAAASSSGQQQRPAGWAGLGWAGLGWAGLGWALRLGWRLRLRSDC